MIYSCTVWLPSLCFTSSVRIRFDYSFFFFANTEFPMLSCHLQLNPILVARLGPSSDLTHTLAIFSFLLLIRFFILPSSFVGFPFFQSACGEKRHDLSHIFRSWALHSTLTHSFANLNYKNTHTHTRSQKTPLYNVRRGARACIRASESVEAHSIR